MYVYIYICILAIMIGDEGPGEGLLRGLEGRDLIGGALASSRV